MSDLIKFNEEESFLPSEPIDVPKIASAYYTDEEIDRVLERIPDEARENYKNHIYEASFWKHIEHKHVPFDIIKKRKGSKIPGTDEYKMLEYFTADYTTSELNRLFPGWWQEDMHVEVDYKLRTVRVWGYLCVEYPTLMGKKVTKRWAAASTAIKLTRDADEKTGLFEASQPDDLEKAALTEWLKIAGKYYGIGLELYTQRVSQEMQQFFETLVKPWGSYADDIRKIAATITIGSAYRDLLRSLPRMEQTARFIKAIREIPAEAKTPTGESAVEKSWKNFVVQRNDSDTNKIQLESFLLKMEATAQQIINLKKQKENQ